MASYLGMVGTGVWDNEERPKRYREGILKMFPNGDAPLTAILSKGRSRRVDDAEFKWFSKDLAAQGGDITDIYTSSDLGTAWTNEAVGVGALVYVKVAEAVADHFRPGHVALLVDKSIDSNDCFGKVISVSKNGASSYIEVKARVASTAAALILCDYIDIIGNSNPEGAPIPDAIMYKPDLFYNYTQIFRTPLDITRTQRRTRMRTGDQYLEQKREALLYHGVEMEGAALFGEKSEVTGDNNQKERTTQGMISFIRENAEDNDINYTTGTSLTWKQGGEDWFDESLELVFRYGRSTKMAFLGSSALLGIMQLVKQSGNFQLTAETGSYGVKVTRWVTPFGDILLKRHPLFTFKAHRRNSCLIFEPENIQFSYIDDTHFKPDPAMKEAGYSAIDGTKEEYLTEAGFEFHFANTMMYLSGVGSDGTA